jgi:ribonuclease P protein component
MFHKANRLAKTKDVKTAFAQGRGFFNPFFTVRFLTRPGHASRFAIVVSAKAAKKAVARNRIKRILREFIRLRLARFKGGDYVVVVKPKVFGGEESVVLKQFEKLLISMKLMDNGK